MKTYKKGFTLIELLVVIGIIGILTAVILPNLGAARLKGQVAAFQSEMDSARKAAESFYSDGNTYNGLFTNVGGQADIDLTNTDPSILNLLTSLDARASDGLIYGAISAGGDAYAIYGRIPGSDTASVAATDIWCVDSTGKSGNPTADATNNELTTNPVSVCW